MSGNMQIMVKQYANGAPGAPRSLVEANDGFNESVSHWFGEFGNKITGSHCLVLNAPKVYWSMEQTKYVRTADLILEPGHGMPDKIIVGSAVEYIAEWKNT